MGKNHSSLKRTVIRHLNLFFPLSCTPHGENKVFFLCLALVISFTIFLLLLPVALVREGDENTFLTLHQLVSLRSTEYWKHKRRRGSRGTNTASSRYFPTQFERYFGFPSQSPNETSFRFVSVRWIERRIELRLNDCRNIQTQSSLSPLFHSTQK